MNNLDIAKQIIKNNFDAGCCGIYDSRNLIGDSMTTLYEDNGLTVDICYYWGYFEVFGLTLDEFDELVKFYKSCNKKE